MKSIKSGDYKYGAGTTLNFVSVDNTLHSTCIFDNSPLYADVQNFKNGNVYHVIGWKTKTHENGNCFIELVDTPDLLQIRYIPNVIQSFFNL